MGKKRVVGWLAAALILILMPITAQAAGKMNIAAICGTDDAKKSALKMSELLPKNKLSLWKVGTSVDYYYDCGTRGTTKHNIDTILDRAFGDSKNGDINYLYIAAHGYQGTDEKDKVYYPDTGIILDVSAGAANGVYKYRDLAKKLVGYKGQFVVFADACFSENFYTEGLSKYPGDAGRFTCFCSAQKNAYAYGAFSYQFFSLSMANALAYDKIGQRLKADTDKDGFVSTEELFKKIKGKSVCIVYGSKKSLLFQFAYVELTKKKAALYPMPDKNKIDLNPYAKRHDAAKSQKVKWKSSNTKVATVSSSGKVTAKKAGSAKITAYFADSKGNMCYGSEDSCTITVIKPSITLKPTSVTLKAGKTKTLTATVKGPSKKVTWSSSNKAIASVNSSGKVTAKKEGTVTITAKANGKKAVCKVTVKPTITLNCASLALNKKQTYMLKAAVKGTSKKVTWSSSDKSIATVNSKGKVTAKQVGTAVITAKVSGVSVKCTVTVKRVLTEKEAETAVRNYVNRNETTQFYYFSEGKSGKYYTFWVTYSSVGMKAKYFVNYTTGQSYACEPYRGVNEWTPSDRMIYKFDAYKYLK